MDISKAQKLEILQRVAALAKEKYRDYSSKNDEKQAEKLLDQINNHK